VFLGYADDDGKGWNDRDREMAKALHLFEHAQCPGCGFPKSEVWVESDSREHDYIAEEVQCQACAALESEKAGKKTEKGLHYYVVRHPRSEERHHPVEREVYEN